MLADRIRMSFGKSRKLIDRTTPTVVVNKPYSTKGNGGRKLVRLDNGWIIAGVLSDNKKIVYLYVDKLNGDGFKQLCFLYNGATYNDIALEARGNIVYIIISLGSTHLAFKDINATLVSNTNMYTNVTFLDQGQTTMGNCSMIFDKKQKILHICWASKNENYPNSFNIRYRRGRINDEENSISWSNVEQVTGTDKKDYYFEYVNIIVDSNNYPLITTIYREEAGYQVIGIGKNSTLPTLGAYVNTPWRKTTILSYTTKVQSAPSACVDKDGGIHVAWFGDFNSMYNIKYAYSSNNGKSWKIILTIKDEYDCVFPSISVNKYNDVFISCRRGNSHVHIVKIINGSSWTTVIDGILYKTNPSSLLDNTLDFDIPLTIMESSDDSSVKFIGKWYE